MFYNILNNILELQQNVLSVLESGRGPELSSVLNLLVQNLNDLLVKTRKNNLYKDFSCYFSLEKPKDFESEDFSSVTTDELELTRRFFESSSKFRLYSNKVVLNDTDESNLLDNNKNDILKHMNYLTKDVEDHLRRVSDKVSFSMDIGGTFIKVLFKVDLKNPDDYEFLRDVYTGYMDCVYSSQQLLNHWGIKYCYEEGDTLSQTLEVLNTIFLSFRLGNELLALKYLPESSLDLVISTIKDKNFYSEGKTVKLTGGGGYKHYDLFNKEFGTVENFDELSCSVRGVGFVLKMKNSFIQYDLINRVSKVISPEPVYPFVLASAGSGMFLLKVDNETEFKHVNGTSTLGGTAYGFVNCLLPLQSKRKFDKVFKKGSNKLDSFTKYPLKNFKTLNKRPPYGLLESLGEFDPNTTEAEAEDIKRSIFDMVSYHAGYTGYLVAKAFGAKRVVYTGNYLCNCTVEAIVAGFSFNSDVFGDKSIEVCFPFHSAYASTLGCFVRE